MSILLFKIVLLGVVAARQTEQSSDCPIFEPVPTQAQVDITRAMLRSFIKSTPASVVPGGSHITACITQLVFHDCVGGCDGCLRNSLTANSLLVQKGGCVDLLETVYQQIPRSVWNEQQPFLSRADFWVLAGIVAIEEAVASCPEWGGQTVPSSEVPKMKFTWGRKDCPTSPYTAVDPIQLPNAAGGMAEIKRVFQNIMEMNPNQFTALIGAHTLGHSHFTEVETYREGRTVTVACGYYNGGRCQTTVWTTKTRTFQFEGPWTTNPVCFDNSFFKALVQNTYTDQPQVQGLGTNQPACIRSNANCFDSDEFPLIPPQTANQPYIMLPSDIALVNGGDVQAKLAVNNFAANNTLWKEWFGEAWQLMADWPSPKYKVGCTLSPTPSGVTRTPTNAVTGSPSFPPTAPTPVPSFQAPPTAAPAPTTQIIIINQTDTVVKEEVISTTTIVSSDHGTPPETKVFPTTAPDTRGPTPVDSPTTTTTTSPTNGKTTTTTSPTNGKKNQPQPDNVSWAGPAATDSMLLSFVLSLMFFFFRLQDVPQSANKLCQSLAESNKLDDALCSGCTSPSAAPVVE